MLAKLALLLLLCCLAKAQIEEELKQVREMLDWKTCMAKGEPLPTAIHQIRRKHQDEHYKSIQAVIEPILKEILAKNKDCNKYYPPLDKPNYYARKMYTLCGGMNADYMIYNPRDRVRSCANLWYAAPEIYELIRRNDEQIKLCDVKDTFERTYKIILSNC